MTRDVVGAAVARVETWIGLYTRGLPREAAEDRRDEVLADVRDQVSWARERDVPAARIARDVTSRALRGAPADVSWAVSSTPPGRLLDGALVCLVAALAAVLAVVGGVALGRRPPETLSGEALVVAVGVVLSFGALILLPRRSTRWLSGLFLIAGAVVVLFTGISYLAGTTTVLQHVATAAPGWRTGVYVALAGITLLGVGAAVWWTRPASPRSERPA